MVFAKILSKNGKKKMPGRKRKKILVKLEWICVISNFRKLSRRCVQGDKEEGHWRNSHTAVGL